MEAIEAGEDALETLSASVILAVVSILRSLWPLLFRTMCEERCEVGLCGWGRLGSCKWSAAQAVKVTHEAAVSIVGGGSRIRGGDGVWWRSIGHFGVEGCSQKADVLIVIVGFGLGKEGSGEVWDGGGEVGKRRQWSSRGRVGRRGSLLCRLAFGCIHLPCIQRACGQMMAYIGRGDLRRIGGRHVSWLYIRSLIYRTTLGSIV